MTYANKTVPGLAHIRALRIVADDEALLEFDDAR